MDRACFRKSREPVSGGAEGLVLGVVCVFFFFGGGGKVPWIRGNLVHFPGRTNQEWAFRIRISERSGSPGAGNFATS